MSIMKQQTISEFSISHVSIGEHGAEVVGNALIGGEKYLAIFPAGPTLMNDGTIIDWTKVFEQYEQQQAD